ncbi:helix-turn-helix transcriptional regulator [uncultured Intestinimonas sp.]|uniref:helix-turn-helix domain-containing protein n=1 Tax=uncultured Intestinimonas sp. TaxID=1689265 RepID=UPI0025E9B00A|nr:helix-turn-helix transcriptional regulator [uncultured Intestinimonas sp.]
MFFRRLADMRVDRDLKQKEVAAVLNMRPEVYRRYEKGIREIPTWAVIALADYYQTSTDYLLGRTDNPSPPHA